MNEWQFTGEVATWISLILEKNRDLPFGKAYGEGQSPDSLKRRDLTIEDRNGRIVLTGEVKLPGKKDGATPYNAGVVKGARTKAQRAKADFLFTWNVNECVLWQTDEIPARTRPDYKHWRVTDVHDAKALEYPIVQDQIKKWLIVFLRDVADVLRGASIIEKKSPSDRGSPNFACQEFSEARIAPVQHLDERTWPIGPGQWAFALTSREGGALPHPLSRFTPFLAYGSISIVQVIVRGFGLTARPA